ncbi:lipoate--protein ligase family protein [Paenibacillus sp. 481]|nr:lipoate--protein ligase family protein [Paenibacillus sp. 481]UHA76002.1 lipoate--protein ligase family protein [Paenibacillus sp. 481]
MLILDRTNDFTEQDVLYSFALDELLCKQTGKGGPPICHLWRHPRAFSMGLRDSRLPLAAQAQQWLEAQGYSTAIRNSGGAAVPLDLGVVNVSLILPKTGQEDVHFHSDFERMYRLIQLALHASGGKVDKGEIEGAYCPGDYDLSVGGRKFCGIAQRRQAHAYIVQGFIVAAGSGRERAQLVREFYERAAKGAENAKYPVVVENSTASLEELIELGPDAAHVFAEGIKRVVRERQNPAVLEQAAERFHLPEAGQVREMAEVLRRRYAI